MYLVVFNLPTVFLLVELSKCKLGLVEKTRELKSNLSSLSKAPKHRLEALCVPFKRKLRLLI